MRAVLVLSLVAVTATFAGAARAADGGGVSAPAGHDGGVTAPTEPAANAPEETAPRPDITPYGPNHLPVTATEVSPTEVPSVQPPQPVAEVPTAGAPAVTAEAGVAVERPLPGTGARATDPSMLEPAEPAPTATDDPSSLPFGALAAGAIAVLLLAGAAAIHRARRREVPGPGGNPHGTHGFA